MQSSPFPFCLVFLRPKYPPQHLFQNTLSLHFFLNVTDRFSQPYKTYKITTKIILVLIIDTFSPSDLTFFDNLSATNFAVYCTFLKLWSRVHSLHSMWLVLTFRMMLKVQYTSYLRENSICLLSRRYIFSEMYCTC